jgi:hypothetical protein
MWPFLRGRNGGFPDDALGLTDHVACCQRDFFVFGVKQAGCKVTFDLQESGGGFLGSGRASPRVDDG